jgi:hypothetical protein
MFSHTQQHESQYMSVLWDKSGLKHSLGAFRASPDKDEGVTSKELMTKGEP